MDTCAAIQRCCLAPVFLKKRRNMNDERCNAFGQTHGQTVSSTHNLRTTHAHLKFYSNGRPGKVVGMVTSDRECSAHDLRERLWPCNTPHMSEDDSTRVVQNGFLCAELRGFAPDRACGMVSLHCIPPLTSDRSKCAQWRVVTHS